MNTTKQLPPKNKKRFGARPYNRYNIYFILERERLILDKGGSTEWSALANARSGGSRPRGEWDQDLPPLPSRFAHLIVPDGWCTREGRGRRRHRKTHGVASFRDISAEITASWKTVDSETYEWCLAVEKALKRRQDGFEREAAAADGVNEPKKKAEDSKDAQSAQTQPVPTAVATAAAHAVADAAKAAAAATAAAADGVAGGVPRSHPDTAIATGASSSPASSVRPQGPYCGESHPAIAVPNVALADRGLAMCGMDSVVAGLRLLLERGYRFTAAEVATAVAAADAVAGEVARDVSPRTRVSHEASPPVSHEDFLSERGDSQATDELSSLAACVHDPGLTCRNRLPNVMVTDKVLTNHNISLWPQASHDAFPPARSEDFFFEGVDARATLSSSSPSAHVRGPCCGKCLPDVMVPRAVPTDHDVSLWTQASRETSPWISNEDFSTEGVDAQATNASYSLAVSVHIRQLSRGERLPDIVAPNAALADRDFGVRPIPTTEGSKVDLWACPLDAVDVPNDEIGQMWGPSRGERLPDIVVPDAALADRDFGVRPVLTTEGSKVDPWACPPDAVDVSNGEIYEMWRSCGGV